MPKRAAPEGIEPDDESIVDVTGDEGEDDSLLSAQDYNEVIIPDRPEEQYGAEVDPEAEQNTGEGGTTPPDVLAGESEDEPE